MKKFLALFALLLLVCTPLFAAAAYGYSISGGTDATAVSGTDTITVKALIFYPNTSTDKCLITTGASTVTFANLTNGSEVISLGDQGRTLNAVKITLTGTTDVLTIVTR
jgi:hypothetical protein